MRTNVRLVLFAALLLSYASSAARAETPEEWIKLGARVHGGFGAFIPVGIRIGEDAVRRLNAQPRELAVIYYSGEKVPCACSVDGVMLAVGASPGQGTVQVAAEKSPPGTFAVVIIRNRKTGEGLKYTVAESWLPQLSKINATILEPLARYNSVMNAADLFTVESIAKWRIGRGPERLNRPLSQLEDSDPKRHKLR
ncbi:MAG: formylmethanofuran dehydrogenase subunit E family protein [Xanthobacteraceae bacterium]|jgi:formylmethanofuran dehydrogenase subunit E